MGETTYWNTSKSEHVEMIRFWWPDRHGINAGNVRHFIRRRLAKLRELRNADN